MSQVTKSTRLCRKCPNIQQVIRILWHDSCGGVGVDHDNHICLECGLYSDASGCSAREVTLANYRKQHGYLVNREGCVDKSLIRPRDVKKIFNGVVRYNCDQKTKDMLFDKMLQWYIDQDVFNGESIMQSDGPLIDGPDLLSEIAEDVFDFDPIWVEKEE